MTIVANGYIAIIMLIVNGMPNCVRVVNGDDVIGPIKQQLLGLLLWYTYPFIVMVTYVHACMWNIMILHWVTPTIHCSFVFAFPNNKISISTEHISPGHVYSCNQHYYYPSSPFVIIVGFSILLMYYFHQIKDVYFPCLIIISSRHLY